MKWKRVSILFAITFLVALTILFYKSNPVSGSNIIGHGRRLLSLNIKPMNEYFDVSQFEQMSDKERQAWCNSVTKDSVYTLGLKLHCPGNAEIALVAILVAVFMTIFIEICTHYLQNRIHSDLTRELIEKIYRELMMIGLISFGVMTLESFEFFDVINVAFFGASSTSVSHKQVKLFEFVHIGIFILSIYYIITAALIYFIIRYVCKLWVYFEREYSLEDQHRIVQEIKRFMKRRWTTRYLNPILNVINMKNYILLSYWRVRQRFVAEHRGEVPEKFPFCQYLKQRARKFLVEICEIGMNTWVTLFVLTGGMFALYHFSPQLNRHLMTIILSIYIGGSILLLTFLIVFILYPYNKYSTDAVQQVLRSQEESLLDDDNVAELEQEEMKYYFPFHSPKFTFYLMQFTIFLQSFFLSLGTMNIYYILVNTNIYFNSIYIRICMLVSLILFPFFVVLMYLVIIPPFVILSSVGSLKSNTLIRETVHWMIKNPNGKVHKNRNHKLNKHHLPYFEDSDRDLRIRNALRDRIQHTLYVAEDTQEIVFQKEVPTSYAPIGIQPQSNFNNPPVETNPSRILRELEQPHMLAFFSTPEARDEVVSILKSLNYSS